MGILNYLFGGRQATEGSSIQDSSIDSPQQEPQSGIRKGDESSYPVVKIPHITSHEDSTRVHIYAHILNTWPEEIKLDKIHLFGTTRILGNFLRGGEEREILVYDGPKLQKETRDAQMEYRTQPEADYFQATYDIIFNYHQNDKTYTPSEVHLKGAIRDIYEN